MTEMIAERRSSRKEERYDLFSNLLDASDEDMFDGQPRLTDRELIGLFNHFMDVGTIDSYIFAGNIFIFLLAGHEVNMSS